MNFKDKIEIDHADIVTSHICNQHCPNCVDKFIHTSNKMISLESVARFLKLLRTYTDKRLTILLLGGEPTVLPFKELIGIATLGHELGFRVTMSTNGILKEKIVNLTPYYDSIQVTVNNDKEIDYYRNFPDKINIKLAADENFNMKTLEHFMDITKEFDRKSITMYFNNNLQQLCTNPEVWAFLDTLTWEQKSSYMYAFYNGVRFKKCIPGVTNIAEEPLIPKLYPSGYYNKTWENEEPDNYLGNIEDIKLNEQEMALVRKLGGK